MPSQTYVFVHNCLRPQNKWVMIDMLNLFHKPWSSSFSVDSNDNVLSLLEPGAWEAVSVSPASFSSSPSTSPKKGHAHYENIGLMIAINCFTTETE